MTHITLKDYFGPWLQHPDATPDCQDSAVVLLDRTNALLTDLGIKPLINPVTKTNISGQTFGGFRPQSCTQGAPNSSHKTGRGVDVYDPQNKLDKAITEELLIKHNLYREHPDYTPGWVHLTTRAPRSGNRSFIP